MKKIQFGTMFFIICNLILVYNPAISASDVDCQLAQSDMSNEHGAVNHCNRAKLGCSSLVTVTNNLDSGSGSFRDAVANVCDSGTIEFQDLYTIQLESTIEIDNMDLIIDGSGQIFESTGTHSIINVTEDSFVRMNETTFRNSMTHSGAITNYGVMLLDHVYFHNNHNSSSTAGGAISNYGSSTIQFASFYQNNASQGGAIFNDGGGMNIVSSTFYQNGNVMTYEGGAIYNNQTLFLLNATIVDSGNGSAVTGNSVFNTGPNSSLQMANTVITSDNPSLSECEGVLTVNPISGWNFTNDGSCEAELTGDPGLGSWGMYGGYAQSIPPNVGSSLINAGSFSYCDVFGNTSDQNYNPRTIGIECDIGAVEFVDLTAPEVLNIQTEEKTVNACVNLSHSTSQFLLTFNEPMLGIEDASQYEFLHAGADQTFLTSDDFLIEVVAAVSDMQRPHPSVELTAVNDIPNGLVRLFIGGDLTDEFFHQLNDGAGVQHPFRMDLGNAFENSHFDDCVNVDPFDGWQINAKNIVTGIDKDDSNASLSLRTQVNDLNPFSISQCINTDSVEPVDTLLMEVHIKNDSNFAVSMSCFTFDAAECAGGQLNSFVAEIEHLNTNNMWQLLQQKFMPVNPLTLSINCAIDVDSNEGVLQPLNLDGLSLKPLTDLIFMNSFD